VPNSPDSTPVPKKVSILIKRQRGAAEERDEDHVGAVRRG
jgi:hypothetical protein